MRYIVSEVQYDSGVQRTAGTKARNDVETILSKEGYKKITIEKNKCGITVDSLYEIADKLKSMTDKEYEDIKKNVQAISPKLKNGYYTKKSIEA